MIRIPLTKGYHAIIDDEDALAARFKWYAFTNKVRNHKMRRQTRVYATGTVNGNEVLLHRFLMGCNKRDARMVDHINGNTLDNRRANLRFVDPKQNAWNACGRKNGLKGVHWQAGKFAAAIMFRGKKMHLGRFVTAEEAHAAYCKKAKELHGEYYRA